MDFYKNQDENFISRVRDSGLDDTTFRIFREMILSFYDRHGRLLPWRSNVTPYRVFISEVMLQQTQVDRVAARFPLFMEVFPDFNALAESSLEKVLGIWKGMGYNRRALALHKSAKIIVEQYNGEPPPDRDSLMRLPGIGPATASSIVVYAFNHPEVYIETNIRSVFIHFFFPGMDKVPDKDILPLVEKTLDRDNPGRWYNALMDKGVMLKKTYRNPSRKSVHYRKQSPFFNSTRQLRGEILDIVLAKPGITIKEIILITQKDLAVIDTLVRELCNEGFFKNNKGRLFIL